MFNLPQNISKRERIVRGILGGLLIIFAILGMGQVFSFILGLALIAYAALDYCAVVHLIEKFNLDKSSPAAPPPADKL